MWKVEQERPSASTIRLVMKRAGEAISRQAFLGGLRDEPEMRELLVEHLAALPFDAFFWETPAVTTETASRAFECVAVDAPGLASSKADPTAFDEHLSRAPVGADAVTFDNLGDDAKLVVPTRKAAPPVYTHLASFLRAAPNDQRHGLLRAVGEAMAGRLGDAPVWLSTAGMGVPWLHVRLDARPKYYQVAAYRTPQFP